MRTEEQKMVGRSFFARRFLCLFALVVLAGLMLVLPRTRAEAAPVGFTVQNGVGYYYEDNGEKHTGWLVQNGRRYYFDASGRQVLGWQGNHTRYFRTTPGAEGYMVTGLYKDTDNKVYYFRPSTGLYARGWVGFNGKYRYFSSTGVMYTGVRKIGNFYYYFESNSDYTKSGYRYQGGFITLSDGKYYFHTSNGRGNVGWLKPDNGDLYYTNVKGKCYVGVYKIGKYNFNFQADGKAAKDLWYELNGNTYYFHYLDGHGHIGLMNHYSGKQYYFTNAGVLYRNTDVTVNGVKYHAAADGVLTKVVSPYSYKVTYDSSGNPSYVTVNDPNGRSYYVAPEFVTHPGIADGTVSDRDLLAAIIECEAGDQGKIGMEAVALCMLNRTIKADREFPSTLRYVIYQIQYPSGAGSYPQYSPVRGGTLLTRIKGSFYNKALAYEAADEALAIFNAHVRTGADRYLEGFDRKDFNFMYFMSVTAYRSASLNFNKVDAYWYKVFNNAARDHMFFVDWV